MNGHDKFLVAYPNLANNSIFRKEQELGIDNGLKVFLDSGAFTVFTQGQTVDVYDYGRWVSKYEDKFELYANLDVIGYGKESAEGTWRNQRILEDEFGLSPLPVFHSGEDWSVLERYLEAGYDYIALGGLVGQGVSNLMPWLVQCFQMGEGAAVFHAFGMTSNEPLYALPWYSADSSSWNAGWRYGRFRVYDGSTGSVADWQIGEPMSAAFCRLARSYGVEPSELVYPGSSKHPSYRQWHETVIKFMASVWHAREAWLREKWGPVFRQNSKSGLNMYLATSLYKEALMGGMSKESHHV